VRRSLKRSGYFFSVIGIHYPIPFIDWASSD
jgi:hypothetical protein